jgi:hypothetical protein
MHASALCAIAALINRASDSLESNSIAQERLQRVDHMARVSIHKKLRGMKRLASDALAAALVASAALNVTVICEIYHRKSVLNLPKTGCAFFELPIWHHAVPSKAAVQASPECLDDDEAVHGRRTKAEGHHGPAFRLSVLVSDVCKKAKTYKPKMGNILRRPPYRNSEFWLRAANALLKRMRRCR